MATPELVIVGRVRKAHGVRGELVIEPLTDSPDEVFAAGRQLVAGTVDGGPDPRAKPLTIESVRPGTSAGGLLVKFDLVGDRNGAELWRDRYLLMAGSELTPLADDELYVHDLIGMRVALLSGDELGQVLEVYELPQGLMLDVQRGTGTVVVPFREPFIHSVDRDARRIIVDPPPGLLE